MAMIETSVSVLPDGRVSRINASAFLGVKPGTMATWATKGIGPRPLKTGGRAYYLIDDLRRFAGTGPEASSGSPSEAEIDAAMTPDGGWTKDQLAKWGVPWPPPKGWRRQLLAKGDQS